MYQGKVSVREELLGKRGWGACPFSSRVHEKGEDLEIASLDSPSPVAYPWNHMHGLWECLGVGCPGPPREDDSSRQGRPHPSAPPVTLTLLSPCDPHPSVPVWPSPPVPVWPSPPVPGPGC